MSDSGQNAREFITCRIGDDEYGVEITAVREIRGWTSTTHGFRIRRPMCAA
jgi:purine-binding chemotaxis protein CheW